MKQLLIFLLCFLPFLISAQNAEQQAIMNHPDYATLQNSLQAVNKKAEDIQTEFKSASKEKQEDENYVDSMNKRMSDVIAQFSEVLRNFVNEHPDSPVSLIAFSQLLQLDFDLKDVDPVYNKISEQVKNSETGRQIDAHYQAIKKTAIGAKAPEFSQNDPEGKPVKLSDFQGKYLLLDFWASWCGPCRKENPNVVKAYNEFKGKNFEILGISLDNPNAKSSWLGAIEKDKLTWPQVSDLQGWKNDVAVLYGVQSIPQNFLLDPNGVIIAKNLRGEELMAKLAEILK